MKFVVKFALGGLVLLLVQVACAQALPTQLGAFLNVPTKGNTTWTLVFATGYFGQDPALANSARSLADRILHKYGAVGDSVNIVAGEMKVWNQSKWPITEAAAHLPVASAPGSAGGCDLEALAAGIASVAKGPILIVSNGPSQLPTNASITKIRLAGGEGQLAGFQGPEHFRILGNGSKSNGLLLTVYKKPGSFFGQVARQTLPNSENARSHRAIGSVPTRASSPVKSTAASAMALSLIIGVALGGAGCSFYFKIGANRTAPPPESNKIDPEEEDHSRPEAGFHDRILASSEKAFAKLNFLGDELADMAGTLRAQVQLTQVEENQEVVRLGKQLKDWDLLAMDFLNAIDRGAQHKSTSDAEREALIKVKAILLKLLQRVGLSEICPQMGEEPEPPQHFVVGTRRSENGTSTGTVLEVEQAGYRRGLEIIRPARVVVED